LYKCAISVSGVSDLPTMLGADKLKWGADSDTVAYLRDTVGLPTDSQVIERSPARAADRVRIPILLIHGLDDTVVPILQSELMAHALEKAHKRYSFVKLKGEDHWMSRADTRLQIMTEIEKFLAANL
ncbi:MAG: alpha/beta hydrolase family protein, partial [Steroidobacteraceae bacterium]